MGGRHAAELVEALELEDDGNELESSVQTACRTHVALTCVVPFAKRSSKRNAQTVVETDGIFIEVVDVNLVVLMVAACFLAHAVVEGILFLVHVGSLTAASAARIFVDIRVLVDDVLGHELVLVGTS